jgi:hypothetical protein
MQCKLSLTLCMVLFTYPYVKSLLHQRRLSDRPPPGFRRPNTAHNGTYASSASRTYCRLCTAQNRLLVYCGFCIGGDVTQTRSPDDQHTYHIETLVGHRSHWAPGRRAVELVRRALASACIVFVVAACGGGTLSLTEYGESFQSSRFAMAAEFDVLEAQWASLATVEDGKELLDKAVAIRRDLQDSLTALDPPKALADFHGDLVEHLGRILAVQKAWAVRAETAGSLEELLGSSEALAYWELDAQMIPLCLELQSTLDETAEREIFAEVPWLPGDLKEVVSVVVGC